jgi:thiol-disulfide isomerase/thioredoxin
MAVDDPKKPDSKFERMRAEQQKRIVWAAVLIAVTIIAMMLAGVRPTLGQPTRLNTGAMAAFVYKPAPADLPALKFVDGEGREKTLRDFAGKTLVLNLWATWCLPCRKEMPDLDKLQATLGSDKFEVVALGVDRGGIAAARKFYEQTGVKGLAVYVDPSARMHSELRVIGLPATLLIDAQGREIGRLLGPADWASAEAQALIKSVMP